MTRSWRHRGEPAAQVLGAVIAYLHLLEAKWESLDDAQRRNAVRLALEAAESSSRVGAASAPSRASADDPSPHHRSDDVAGPTAADAAEGTPRLGDNEEPGRSNA